MAEIDKENLRLYTHNFLKEFKALLGHRSYNLNKFHHKNKQTILKLGFTEAQILDVLYSLEIEDYCNGPIPDEYHPGDYWVFGKQVDCLELYIKLKIVTKPSGDETAFCISFHESEFPLRYPFSKAGDDKQ